MKMPKEKVKWIEYLLEKHGEDYEVILVKFVKYPPLSTNLTVMPYNLHSRMV